MPKPCGFSTGAASFIWCWCDALFMLPPVWNYLSQLTGDPKYLDFASEVAGRPFSDHSTDSEFVVPNLAVP